MSLGLIIGSPPGKWADLWLGIGAEVGRT